MWRITALGARHFRVVGAFVLAPPARRCAHQPFYNAMVSPETFNHIENIKKRAGHLWRFL
jgi:hypothetical protein